MHRLVVTLLVLWACELVLAPHAWANPSDRQPHAPLEVHSPELAPELLAQAQQLFDQNQLALGKFDEQRVSGKVAAIDPLKVGQAYAHVLKLRRTAEQLMQLGEPAGYDYELRASRQALSLNVIIGALQGLPQAQQAIANTRTRALQVSQTRLKQIPRLERMVADEAWLKAEAELHETLSELELYFGFLTVEDRLQITMPWRELTTKIETAAKSARHEIAKEKLLQRREAAAPHYEELLRQVEAAAESVRASGKHTLDSTARTGPELLAHFDAAWQTLHVQAINALAIEWARATLIDRIPSPEWTAAEEDYANFAEQMSLALAGVIEADAMRVSDATARELYMQYLSVVADLIAHAPASEPALSAALARFEEKSPALQDQVASYRAATSELLRWRQRVARERATARAAGVLPLQAAAREWFLRSEESGGLFERSDSPDARLNDPAGQILATGGPKAVGRPVVVGDIVALGGGTAGISRYGDRVYARVALPKDDAKLLAAREALKRDLQATVQPPLWLEATLALRALERGDWAQIGGDVKGVYLEGHIPRFATLPTAAALLTPLGKLPASHTKEDQLAQMVLRVDVTPQWILQEYFFVELAPQGVLPP
jgi:hypothetical protein